MTIGLTVSAFASAGSILATIAAFLKRKWSRVVSVKLSDGSENKSTYEVQTKLARVVGEADTGIQDEEEIHIGSLLSPSTISLDKYVERQKKTRERIALLLTCAVIGLVCVPIISAAIWPDHLASMKEIVTLVLPTLTAVVGFYFGRLKY